MERQGSDSSGEENLGFEDLVASYVDRLNAGERLTPERILAEEPDLGPEILEHLRALVDADLELVGAGAARTFGDYTLRRQVGRGGMGLVYEAWQGSLDRRVALKVLPPGLAADTKACSRFLREAQIVAKLSHPSLVPVHGFGVESGTPYYAMDFVEGETLAQIVARMRAGGPSARTAFGPSREDIGFYAAVAGAFADVADGLQHAHSRGVVHRDVKPSNLILETSAAPGHGVEGGAAGSGTGSGSSAEGGPVARLRILDFGLARLEGQESLSATGDVVGTPLYMSPEQARRRKVPVDHRTDVYSLGATLYEVLTLEPPFRGKDHEDTLSQIIQRDPRPPRQLNPRVPRDLETVVLKCLRKEPGERYGTAEALGQDLRRFVRGDPIEARGETRWERARRRLRRRWKAIASAAMLLALGVLAGLLMLERAREDARRRDAEYDARLLGVAARIQLDSMTIRAARGAPTLLDPDGIFQLFQAYPPVPGQGRESLESLLQELEILADSAPWRPDAWFHRARALEILGRTEHALADLRRALACDPGFIPAILAHTRIQAEVSETPRATGRIEAAVEAATPGHWGHSWAEAELALEAGDWNVAEAAYGTVLSEAASAYVGLEVEARLGRGYARLRAERLPDAVEDLAYAKERWPKALAPYLLLAEAYRRNANREAAFRVLEEAHVRSQDPRAAAFWAAVFSRRFRDNEQGLSWARRSGSADAEFVFLFELGKVAEARDIAEASVASNPKDANTRLWLAIAEHETTRRLGGNAEGRRRLARAETLASEALTLDPKLPFAHAFLGGVLLARGQRHAAMSELREELGRNAGTLSVCLYTADRLMMHGLAGEAEEVNRLAQAAGQTAAEALGWLGSTLVQVGRLAEAERWLRLAIDANPMSPTWNGLLGLALQGRGNVLDAASYTLRAVELDPTDPWAWYGYRAVRPARDLARLLLAVSWGDVPVELEDRLSRTEDESIHEPAPNVSRALAVWRLRSERRRDPERALEHAERAAASTGFNDPEILTTLAEALVARGRLPDAVQALEAAMMLPSATPAVAALLEEHRERLLPVLASAASVDALVERLSSDPSAIERVVADQSSNARRVEASVGMYLEARLLELRGDVSSAAIQLEALAALPGAETAVVLRLADVALALAKPEEALLALERGLRTQAGKDEGLWRRWAAVALGDLELTPEAALERLERIVRTDAGVDGATFQARWDDLAWLIRALAEQTPLRIDCGATEDPVECPGWSRDRFYSGGYASKPSFREIADTEREALYQTARFFWSDAIRSGYAIPLPGGRWKVTMHFAETREWEPGKRRFSVVCEGQRIVESFDPAIGGISRAVEVPAVVEVVDGTLDLGFVAETGQPLVCGIEVERADR